MENNNKVWLVEAYGFFQKYDVCSVIVYAPDEKMACICARENIEEFKTRVLTASEICPCTQALAVSYADKPCEVLPDAAEYWY